MENKHELTKRGIGLKQKERDGISFFQISYGSNIFF